MSNVFGVNYFNLCQLQQPREKPVSDSAVKPIGDSAVKPIGDSAENFNHFFLKNTYPRVSIQNAYRKNGIYLSFFDILSTVNCRFDWAQ